MPSAKKTIEKSTGVEVSAKSKANSDQAAIREPLSELPIGSEDEFEEIMIDEPIIVRKANGGTFNLRRGKWKVKRMAGGM